MKTNWITIMNEQIQWSSFGFTSRESIWEIFNLQGLVSLQAFKKNVDVSLLLQKIDRVTWVRRIFCESLNIKPYRHGLLSYVGSFHLQWQYAALFVILNEETSNFQEILYFGGITDYLLNWKRWNFQKRTVL